MKKLLGLSVLVVVLVLSACGSSDETVCTIRMLGEEMTFIAESEDGVITAITTEIRIDISGLFEDEIADIVEAEGGVVEGNYIVVSETETPSSIGMSAEIDAFRAGIELIGGSCD